MPSKKKPAAKPAAKPPGKPKAASKPKPPAKAQARAKPAGKPSPAAGKSKPKAKPEAVPTEAGEKSNVRALVTALIVEQKHTDQEMIAQAAKAFPDRTVNINIIGACRSELNHGMRLPEGIPEGTRFEQIVKVDGVNVPKSERPAKPPRNRKPLRGKVSPENDPLSKIGIAPAKRAPARKAPAAA